MSETEPSAAESTVTSYDDPDAPWNQDFSDTELANWNDDVIEEFRSNGGKVGGSYAGAELLLLTTTGAKSGKPRTVPLGVLRRDDTLYLSSFIEDKYPAWYHNVKVNPQVTVELAGSTQHGTAHVLAGAEYDEFANWALTNNPFLADFQAKVELPIPLVVLTLDQPS
ncbi:nitroreductase family deazaflavin-dependent oxidoreductase [Nocardia altamirensis]|uniref:nitroreductase family deazaflavin-dependent oxidoreductase n=1 Tax=Nocardia altamirensis TaxID=472158 RepID=UPI00083FE0FE|nr:nitroreductase family deazaflavin-dependent oxidoreductase [Nocardia altamirensis]